MKHVPGHVTYVSLRLEEECWKVVCRGVKGCGGVGTDEGQDVRDASLI